MVPTLYYTSVYLSIIVANVVTTGCPDCLFEIFIHPTRPPQKKDILKIYFLVDNEIMCLIYGNRETLGNEWPAESQ